MTGMPMVLSDEPCKWCDGYGASQRGYGNRCDLCRGTGGTWITLAEGLARLRRPNEGALWTTPAAGGRGEVYSEEELDSI